MSGLVFPPYKKKLRGELLPRAATMSGRLFGFKPVFVFIVFSYF
jgi:hypothetical protein